MATDDRQVLVTGRAPTPATFRVPGNGQLRPKTVFASFDGSGAGGDFQPALKIVSDAGEVVGIFPTDSTVTAGGSVDVSWAPFLGRGGGTTPTSTALAFAQGYSEFTTGDPVQAVVSGGNERGEHAHVETTDSSVLSWFTTFATNDSLSMAAHGTYLVWSTAFWQASSVDLNSTIMNQAVTGFRHDPFRPTVNATAVPSDGLANSQDYDVFHVTGGGAFTYVLHQNGTGADSSVNAQYLTAVFLGTG